MQNWNGMSAPHQSRSATAASLGSLGGSTLAGPTLAGSTLATPTLLLPRPGAPEPIGVTQAMGGCSCSGSCGCGTPAVGDFIDNIPGGWLTLGVGAILAFHFLRKKRRR